MPTSATQLGAPKTAKKKDLGHLQQAQSALQGQQQAFSEITKEPNTLTRNIVLAEHRSEIARLQKLVAKYSAS